MLAHLPKLHASMLPGIIHASDLGMDDENGMEASFGLCPWCLFPFTSFFTCAHIEKTIHCFHTLPDLRKCLWRIDGAMDDMARETGHSVQVDMGR